MSVYVGNAFSPNMVGDGVTVRFTLVTKDEYLEAAVGGYCVIGHPEIASALGLPFNREHISLAVGDVLYVVSPSHRPKTELYDFVPEAKGWLYRKCEVLP